MAIITFDIDKQKVYVVAEEKDIINTRDKDQTIIANGSKYTLGKVFVDEKLDICVIRGER